MVLAHFVGSHRTPWSLWPPVNGGYFVINRKPADAVGQNEILPKGLFELGQSERDRKELDGLHR